MGLIVIFAFLATIVFYRRAKQIGIHPGKAASIPFVGAGMMLVFTYLGAFAIGRILMNTDVSTNAITWFGRGIDWCLILSYCYYIKRNWDLLSRLPSVSERVLCHTNSPT